MNLFFDIEKLLLSRFALHQYLKEVELIEILSPIMLERIFNLR